MAKEDLEGEERGGSNIEYSFMTLSKNTIGSIMGSLSGQ